MTSLTARTVACTALGCSLLDADLATNPTQPSDPNSDSLTCISWPRIGIPNLRENSQSHVVDRLGQRALFSTPSTMPSLASRRRPTLPRQSRLLSLLPRPPVRPPVAPPVAARGNVISSSPASWIDHPTPGKCRPSFAGPGKEAYAARPDRRLQCAVRHLLPCRSAPSRCR